MISQKTRLALMKYGVTYDKEENMLWFCNSEAVALNPFTETDEDFIDSLNLIYRGHCTITDLADGIDTAEGKEALGKIITELNTLSKRIPLGTVFASSWGYDAEHNYWYEVVKSTEKTVWLRQLQKEYKNRGAMVYYSRPLMQPYGDKIIRKKVNRHGDKVYVNISNYESADMISMTELTTWKEEFDD